MKKFSEILSTLDNADHVQRIVLTSSDGSPAGMIENKPGSQGSVKVYCHLYNKFGSLDVAAAQEGLALYAEHTQDARSNPGKHPNIDRLFGVIASGQALTIEIIGNL